MTFIPDLPFGKCRLHPLFLPRFLPRTAVRLLSLLLLRLPRQKMPKPDKGHESHRVEYPLLWKKVRLMWHHRMQSDKFLYISQFHVILLSAREQAITDTSKFLRKTGIISLCGYHCMHTLLLFAKNGNCPTTTTTTFATAVWFSRAEIHPRPRIIAQCGNHTHAHGVEQVISARLREWIIRA